MEKSGAAIWLKKDDDIDATINSLLKDTAKLEKMKNCCSTIAKPNSTMDICQTILGKLC